MGGKKKVKLCFVGKSASVEPEHLVPLAAARLMVRSLAGWDMVGAWGWEQGLASCCEAGSLQALVTHVGIVSGQPDPA